MFEYWKLPGAAEFLRVQRAVSAASGISVRQIVVLLVTSLCIVVAETTSIGLIYPALAFLEKGPVAYLATLPPVLQATIHLIEGIGIQVGLGVILSMALGSVLLRTGLQLTRDRLITSMVHRGISNMRSVVFREVLKANLEFHRNNPSARIHMAIVSNINGAARLVPESTSLLAGVIQVVLLFGLLAIVSLPMALLGSTMLAVLGGAYRYFYRAGRSLSRDNVEGYIKLKVRTLESLQNTRLIKGYGMEDVAASMFNRDLSRVFANDFRINFYSSFVESTTTFLFAAVSLLLFYLGAVTFGMVLSGLGLFMVVMLRLQPAVGLVGRSLFSVSTGLEAWKETEQLLGAAGKAKERYEKGLPFERVKKSIVFAGVSFNYRTSDRVVPAVKDLDLTIAGGEIIGIVGKSGAGKSTLVDLLPRFIEPERGTVTIDGVDIARMDLQALRRGIGYVPQEPLMFDDTIRANLTYGLNREVTDDALRAALEAAHGMDILQTMSAGLDTMVGERGTRLSGGQKQRLALARAILAENSILILDEPTNALDVQSEMGVRQTLLELRGKVTIIIIAHRRETVEIADRILLIREGRLIDDGRHDELAARNQYYRDLFSLDESRGENAIAG